MTLQYNPGGDLIYKACGPPRGQLMGCCQECSARPCTDCASQLTLTIEKVYLGDPYYLDACGFAGEYLLEKAVGDGCAWAYTPDEAHPGWQIELRLMMSGGSITDYCLWQIYMIRTGAGGATMGFALEREETCPPEGEYGLAFEIALGTGSFVGYGKATISA